MHGRLANSTSVMGSLQEVEKGKTCAHSDNGTKVAPPVVPAVTWAPAVRPALPILFATPTAPSWAGHGTHRDCSPEAVVLIGSEGRLGSEKGPCGDCREQRCAAPLQAAEGGNLESSHDKERVCNSAW